MKFCAACGAPLHGGKFCPSCGATVASASPEPPAPSPLPQPTAVQLTVEPVVESAAPVLPPLRAARAQRNWPALITGLAALALLAGGVTFFVMRDSGDESVGSVSSDAVTTTPSGSATSDAPVTTPVLDPAAQLAASRDADRPTVEALVGRWVPQLSAKREGLVADGITYTLADIVALHGSLQAEYGALLVWSGEYVFDQADLWVSLAPDSFATAQEALDWCVAKARDRDNCLARFVTHDPSITPTLQLQP